MPVLYCIYASDLTPSRCMPVLLLFLLLSPPVVCHACGASWQVGCGRGSDAQSAEAAVLFPLVAVGLARGRWLGGCLVGPGAGTTTTQKVQD